MNSVLLVVRDRVKLRLRTALAAATALFCACGAGAYSVPGPSNDARAGDVTNDSLALRASAATVNERFYDFKVEIQATNRLDRPLKLMVPGGCPVILQVLTAAPPAGRVVWDSQYTAPCALSLVQVTINPGETKTFARGVARADILGDSLPAARYFVRGLLAIQPAAITVNAGEIMISK